MKVYLINPPAAKGVPMVREGRCMQRRGAWTAIWPPISLTISGAILEKEGIKVKISDCIVEKIDFERLMKMIEEFNPKLVVLNTATPSIESDLSVCKLVKDINPECKTVAFGIHVTALPEQCLGMEGDLDFIIRGEPEITLKELCLALRDNKDLTAVNGISFRRENRVIRTKNREPLKNLDELPYPAWHLINPRLYKLPFTQNPFLMVATGRGCPHRCIYCAAKTYYGVKIRVASPKRIVDEMQWVKDKFGIEDFLFWSESFTIKKGLAEDVSGEILNKKLKVNWICNSRVDNINLEMLKKMKEAGCWMIGYGIESGNQEILDINNKGITLEQSKNAVMWAKGVGLEVIGHFILGLPGETKQTINETINFANELDLDYAQFYCAVPFPGSKLYDIAKQNGWINTDSWAMFEQNFSVLDMNTINAGDIMALRSNAFKRFYTRPKIIFRNLKKIRTLNEFKTFIWMLRDFLDWM